MKTVREKFLTVAEAENVTGVHYTVKHSGKMENPLDRIVRMDIIESNI